MVQTQGSYQAISVEVPKRVTFACSNQGYCSINNHEFSHCCSQRLLCCAMTYRLFVTISSNSIGMKLSRFKPVDRSWMFTGRTYLEFGQIFEIVIPNLRYEIVGDIQCRNLSETAERSAWHWRQSVFPVEGILRIWWMRPLALKIWSHLRFRACINS